MARKPSRIARQRCAVVLIVCLSLVPAAAAQNSLRVSQPPATITNRFATGGAAQHGTAPAEKQSAGRAAKTYQNPFTSTSPPLSIPLRPGPISRWQRVAGVKQPSTTATAILSAAPIPIINPPTSEPVAQAAIEWDRLPPIEEMHAIRSKQGTTVDVAPSAQTVRSPDPIRFAANNLTQPAWMLPDSMAIPLPANNGGEESSPKAVLRDPFELNSAQATYVEPQHEGTTGNLDEPAAFPATNGSLSFHQSFTAKVPPTSPSMLAVIVSDFVDSPDGWYTQAERLAQSAATLEDLSAVADRCQQGLRSGATGEAAGSLRRLAAWAHNRRGELLAEAHQSGQALAEFQAAITLDQNCVLAIHNRGVTFAQQDRLQDALRDFNRVVELNPGLVVAYRNRAELLATLGSVDEALRDYDRALEPTSDDADLYRARAHALQRLGDLDRALADFNQAVRLSPENAVTYCERGNLAAERGDFTQAIRDLERAVRLDPQFADAYRSLAWLLATCPNEQFRDAAGALAAAQQGAALIAAPDHFMLDALAAAQASAGEFDDAVATIRRAIAAAPRDAIPPLERRLKLYQLGRPFLNELPADVPTASGQERKAEQPRTANRR